MADLKQAEEQLDNHILCLQEEKTFILRASEVLQREQHVVRCLTHRNKMTREHCMMGTFVKDMETDLTIFPLLNFM